MNHFSTQNISNTCPIRVNNCYGFNGKETDQETGTQDYGFRIYNPAIAKFLSVDPLSKKFPWQTPYCFAANCPIQLIDFNGNGPIDPDVGDEFTNQVSKIILKTSIQVIEDGQCRGVMLPPGTYKVEFSNGKVVEYTIGGEGTVRKGGAPFSGKVYNGNLSLTVRRDENGKLYCYGKDAFKGLQGGIDKIVRNPIESSKGPIVYSDISEYSCF